MALAVKAVIDDQEARLSSKEAQDPDATALSSSRIIHPRPLDPNFSPQHVPTARRRYSIPVAEKMRELGHTEAADATRIIANWYAAYDWRGMAPQAKWDVWAAADALFESLDESLRPDSIRSAPTSMHVSGYSRVAVEGLKMANDSSRQEDVMVGHEMVRHV